MLPGLPGPVWRAGLDWPARLPTSVVQHGLLGGEFQLQTPSKGMHITMITMNMQVSEVLGYSEEIVGSEDMMESQLDLPVECVQVQRETAGHPNQPTKLLFRRQLSQTPAST